MSTAASAQLDGERPARSHLPGQTPNRVTSDDFVRLLREWHGADEVAFRSACEYLWTTLYEGVLGAMIAMSGSPDTAREVVADGFWMAMEEADLLVSEGRILCDRRDSLKGRVSGRELGPRAPREYLVQLLAASRKEPHNQQVTWDLAARVLVLVRQLWTRRAIDCLRRVVRRRAVEYPLLEDGAVGAAVGRVHSKTGVRGTHSLFMRMRPDGTSNYLTAAHAAPGGNEARAAIEAESIGELGRALANVESQHRSRAVRDTAGATLRYVKWRISRCNPGWREATRQQAAQASLEELMDRVDLSGLDVSSEGWLRFLQEELALASDALYQRVHRLRAAMSSADKEGVQL